MSDDAEDGDGGDGGADDLPWFVRPLEDDEPDMPSAAARSLIDTDDMAAAWQTAEATLAGPLAAAALQLGRLSERMVMGTGPDRLRCREVSDLMWRVGHGVRAERLALYDMDGGVARGSRADSYALAHWTLRRMGSAPDLTSAAGLRDWLGWGARPVTNKRSDTQPGGCDDLTAPLATLMDVPSGAEAEAALERIVDLMRALAGCTGLTRGAALAFHWGRDPAFGRARESTAMMLGALIGGEMMQSDFSGSAPPFAPVAIGAGRSGGPRVMAAPGAGTDGQGAGLQKADLASWLAATTAATTRALLDLNALALWQARAGAVAAGIQGRVAGEMVTALAGQVALSASMAATLIGCTPESAERALAKLEAAGLAREITGGRRWRFWCARV